MLEKFQRTLKSASEQGSKLSQFEHVPIDIYIENICIVYIIFGLTFNSSATNFSIFILKEFFHIYGTRIYNKDESVLL